MWTWLRTLLPEPEPVAPFAGDADGINWYNVAQNQRFAVLRKGGLMNLASTWRFALFGAAGCFLLADQVGREWLLLPALASLWFALGLYRRYRLIVDTPTSRLSSSAQGYVELSGTAALPDGESSRGLPHLPVTVWLPGYVEDQPFLLEDAFGRCLLYPQAAEIVTRTGDNHLFLLHAIYPGQTLYALGELRTQRQAHGNVSQERRERLAVLLADWKRDDHTLLQNFDADGNGQIDPDEWQTVLVAAEQWVDADIRAQQRLPGTHVMSGAQAGQLFLITNIPPEQLAQRYQWAAWLHTLAWWGLMAAAHIR